MGDASNGIATAARGVLGGKEWLLQPRNTSHTGPAVQPESQWDGSAQRAGCRALGMGRSLHFEQPQALRQEHHYFKGRPASSMLPFNGRLSVSLREGEATVEGAERPGTSPQPQALSGMLDTRSTMGELPEAVPSGLCTRAAGLGCAAISAPPCPCLLLSRTDTAGMRVPSQHRAAPSSTHVP